MSARQDLTPDSTQVSANGLRLALRESRIADQKMQTVDARRLHKFLGVGRRFASWIVERIAEYGFVENQDFVITSPNREVKTARASKEGFSRNGEKPLGGRPTIEYHISLDMAKELSMVERTDRGREARRYFIECEKIALGKDGSGDPDDLSTVRDRRPLYHGAVDIVVSYRLSFCKAYQALNYFAGVERFPNMTKKQVKDASGFAQRLLVGEATQKDFARIALNQIALTGESPQMTLAGIALMVPDED